MKQGVAAACALVSAGRLSNSTRCCVLHKGVGEPCTHSLLHRCRRDEAGQVQRVTVDGMERDMKVKFLRVRAALAWLRYSYRLLACRWMTGAAQAAGWRVVACGIGCWCSMFPPAHPLVPLCPPLLQALSNRIQAKRLCLGQVDRILHARVPILKFRDLSGGRAEGPGGHG